MSAAGKALVRYALASLALVTALGVVLALVFTGEEARRALLISGLVVAVVQSGAFMLARRASPANRIAGWGAGAGISLLSLIAFGFVARAQGMPLEPALLGMATYLFATELIEPFFLR
jgi:hypothetical protein